MLKNFFKFIAVLFSLGILASLFVLGLMIYISYELPQINSLSDYNPPIPSRIYSKDGELLMEISKEKREIIEMDKIPPMIVHAFLAAEDDNFYNHSGVDFIGIARAMFKNLQAGRIVQGASTITQQVAKSLLLSSERTYTRKIKDLLLAKKIEEQFSKEEILFLYLNQVYLGGGYYGIKTAFKGYFGKELEEATIAESALIAGLLVAPGKYSPYVNPQYAKTRQKYVLGRMLKTDKITQIEYDNAIKENIQMQVRQLTEIKAGYFSDWIRQKMLEKFGKDDFLTNGYQVVTTLDWSLQKKAEDEVLKGAKEMDKRQGYHGPLKLIENDVEIKNFYLEQRKAIYDEHTSYFTFYHDGTVRREHQYEDGELEKILLAMEEQKKLIPAKYNSKLETGLLSQDKISELIHLNKNYEAIVISVNDAERIIYVQFAGGMKAIIPYEGFRWVHDRQLSEDPSYWSYLTRPSQVFKPGHVILINITGSPSSAFNHIYADAKKLITDNALKELMNAQKFFVAEVDQWPEVQAALLAISPLNGEIVSMVGGTDFSKSQFNRTIQSNRQPGSAFKPLLFAVGLENGYTAASTLLDSPSALGGVDDSLSWKPRNYDGKFLGQMTFRRALEVSRNIPTIRLTQDVGVDKIVSFVHRLKLNTQLPNDLSISLGSFGMNLLDLVKTYGVFPNGGQLINTKSILSIKDRFNKVHVYDENMQLEKSTIDSVKIRPTNKETDKSANEEDKIENQNPFMVNLNETQVYDQRLAYIMTNLLKGVIQSGTGAQARDLSSFIGGKTGTTNNYVDAWFIGFSSKLVTGVWTGFDDNKTLGFGETGARSALPIWKEYMKLALKRVGEHEFPIPSGIINMAINKETGKIAKPGTSGLFMESFVEGTQPGIKKEEVDTNTQDISDTIIEDDDYYISQ
jgi:penicillin-binding protein 1A